MISILLPSRHRPRNIARFIDSFYQNARAGDILNSVEFWFYIDEDDKLSPPELKYQKAEYDGLVNINWIVGARTAISDMYNRLYEHLTKPDLVLISGDDCICRTEGWDIEIENAFKLYKDRIVLVGGKDLLNESLFTTFVLSKEYIDVFGKVMPEGFWDYSDTWHWHTFSMINRIHKINIVIEHMHVSNNKAPMDDTMREKNLRCYGGPIGSHIKFDQERHIREQLAERLLLKINDSKVKSEHN